MGDIGMPTTKPRITLTIEPALYETITRLAQLQHRPRSAIVGELLAAIHPPLQRTVALLDAASKAPAEVRGGLRHAVEDMERQMVGASGFGMAGMDWLTDEMNSRRESFEASDGGRGEAAESQAQAARAASPTIPNPHVVTRGSHPRKTAFHRKTGGGEPSPSDRRFRVEDRVSGERWKPGLTWTAEAADRALRQAKKSDPSREWILRETGE